MGGVTPINANIPFVIGDSYHQIANNITMLEIDTLTDTFSLLDGSTLNKATNLLKSCKRIDVYAQSYFLLLAEIFEQNMSLINKNVRICRLTADGSFQAYNSDQDVCAILLPMSSHHQYIESIARILHDREVPIITITPSIEEKGLSSLSNVVIQTSAKEKNGVKLGNFALSLSINLIFDVLYSCIFSADYQKNIDMSSNYNNFMNIQ